MDKTAKKILFRFLLKTLCFKRTFYLLKLEKISYTREVCKKTSHLADLQLDTFII